MMLLSIPLPVLQSPQIIQSSERTFPSLTEVIVVATSTAHAQRNYSTCSGLDRDIKTESERILLLLGQKEAIIIIIIIIIVVVVVVVVIIIIIKVIGKKVRGKESTRKTKT
jgi:t-SNARE complex subunit (syntaxin)